MSKRIKGTKPTLMQRRALERRRGINPDDWLFVKSEVIQEGDGNLKRSTIKNERLHFIHKTTGEPLEIPGL